MQASVRVNIVNEKTNHVKNGVCVLNIGIYCVFCFMCERVASSFCHQSHYKL